MAKAVDSDGEQISEEEGSREMVDLTHEQTAGGDDVFDEFDDFDLLDANVDPMDLKTNERVRKLEAEITAEKQLIAIKMAYRSAMQPDDPLKITE